MDLPLISVITPVLNNVSGIEKNINSVLAQTYPNIEHIVIDGGSQDGTVEALKRISPRINYWISEKDYGVYHAMNKGIERAGGEWLYFLCSDDIFYDNDVLERIFMSRTFPTEVVAILGKVILFDGRVFKSKLSRWILFKNTVHHQGVFYKNSIFKNFRYGSRILANGRNYRVSGDYELNLKLYFERANFLESDLVFAVCGKGLSYKGNFDGYLEEIMIRKSFVGQPVRTFYDFSTILRFLFKRVRLRRFLCLT